MTDWFRDRLVCGIQRRLLSERDLTFDKALKLAQAIETASKDVRDLQSLEAATPHERMPQAVHKVTARQSSSEQHRAGDCRFANESCHKCGKTGIFRRCVGRKAH